MTIDNYSRQHEDSAPQEAAELELLRDALRNLIETYGTDSPMWWQARAALSSSQEAAEGECRSCFNGKCVTGRECVTLGLDDEGHRATMNLKEIQALFASVEWMTSNPKAAEKIRAELAATLYEIERVSAPQEASKAEQKDWIRSMNLEADIRRVIGWEKPINDFDVVKELQEYIALLAASKEAGKVEAVADERSNASEYVAFLEREFGPSRGQNLPHFTIGNVSRGFGAGWQAAKKLYLRPSQQALSVEAKDALRYRWLREVWPMTLLEDLLQKSVGRHPSAELDKAIDSAILAAGGTK